MVVHAEKNQLYFHVYISEANSNFRYDLKSEKWEHVLENITPFKWFEHKETSYEFVQILVSQIIPYHFKTLEQNSKCTHSYPFVLVLATDKIWRVGKIIVRPLPLGGPFKVTDLLQE